MQRLTNEEFIRRAKSIHGDKYDYSRTLYTAWNGKVEIDCSVHGAFKVLPAVHLRKTGTGCPSCGKLLRSFNRRVNLSEFIARSKAMHGDRYDYSLIFEERPSATFKVPVICAHHGVFKVRLRDHAKGVGCTGCMSSGFRKALPGHVYVFLAERYTKVGVTNRTPTIRARELRRRSGKRFEILTSAFFKDGEKALNVEMELLQFLKDNFKQSEESHEGSTETFIDVDRVRLLEILDKKVRAYGG